MTSLRPVRIAPPTELPVTLEQAKVAAKVDWTEEDDFIIGLIEAAVDHLDGRAGVLGRCLMRQTWRYRVGVLTRDIRLGMPDAVDATITYETGTGETAAVDRALYRLEEYADGSRLCFEGWTVPWIETGNRALPFNVDVIFGVTQAEVPRRVRQIITLLVAHWFWNRSAVGDKAAPLPLGVDTLISGYRWRSF